MTLSKLLHWKAKESARAAVIGIESTSYDTSESVLWYKMKNNAPGQS